MGEDRKRELRLVGGLLPLGKLHECIEAILRVRQHVALGMPRRFLLGSSQLRDLWKMAEPAGFFQHLQSARWLFRFDGPLFPLAPNPFQRKFSERVRDRVAERGRFVCEGKIETRRELKNLKWKVL